MGKGFYWITTFALILSISVIMLGAYTRLSDAGLGCPDWPGCYGKLVLPKNKTQLAEAQQQFPNTPLVATKAWTEMLHRYLAGTLGVLIILLAGWRMTQRFKNPAQPLLVPILLLSLLAFQVILGMWTVTLKLIPIVVVAHLMGGMAIAGLLCWLRSCAEPMTTIKHNSHIKPWALFGLTLLILQIFLGAWTSTHYAALACPGFPFCHGSLFPTLTLAKAFNFMTPIGPNYQGGHLGMDARITIQMIHRYGAFITAGFWIPFALYLILTKTYRHLRRWGWSILILVAIQIMLGIINVVKLLPMSIAVSHTGIATLLLVVVIAFIHRLTRHQPEPAL